jgi:hypothetical protein
MLKIGKSKKYYTLWDVTSEIQYTTNLRGDHLPSYNKVSFTYLQNLSLDLATAVAKAKSKGVTELEPDEELYGKYSSWSRREYIQRVYEPYQFRFGKYESSDIRECEDSQYLRWYYTETDNEFARDRVIELEPTVYTIYEDRLEKIENVEKWENEGKLKKEIEKSIKANGYVDVFVPWNVGSYGDLKIDGVDYYFEQTKEQWYNGRPYYLPCINGKGKRIKNKNVRFHTSLQVETGFSNGRRLWKVDDLEIIKK